MRWTLGPEIAAFDPDAAAEPAPAVVAALPDPVVTLKGVEGRNCTFAVEPYTAADHAHLKEIRVYVAPEGEALPATADEFVASPLAYGFEDASACFGGDVVVVRPAVTARSVGRALFGFEA